MRGVKSFHFFLIMYKGITKKIKNETWYLLKDILKEINLRQISKEYINGKDLMMLYLPSNRGPRKNIFISTEGLKVLLSSSRKEKAKKLCHELGLNISIYLKDETQYISIIKRSFSHIESIEQYNIGIYYIDLYFPKLKLAVECDEKGHKYYKTSSENIREDYIKKVLKCEIIRFNPSIKMFNIGDVIKDILAYAKRIENLL